MATNRTHLLFSSRKQVDPTTYIGEEGRLFYNQDTGEMRLSDGVTPNGKPVKVDVIGLNGLPVGGLVNDTLLKSSINDYDVSWGIPSYSVPTGGLTNQMLMKSSDNDYDTFWGVPTADFAPDAKRIIALVQNDTTATILKGTPVYQTGTIGNTYTIGVGAADAANPTKMPAIGILDQDLVPGAVGNLIILGEIRDVDTSSFNESDPVYVAPGGGYTNVIPTALNIAVQFLGIVTRVHATKGGGYVTGTGAIDDFRGDLPDGFYGWDGTQWIKISSFVVP